MTVESLTFTQPRQAGRPRPVPRHRERMRPVDDRKAESSPPSSGGAEQARRLFSELAVLPRGSAQWERVREQIVCMHLPLTRQLASRYVGRGEPLDDLLQAANVGLVKALERFDLTYGTEFSSYAVPTILGELKKHFRDTVWRVHVPRRSQELRLAVAGAAEELTQAAGRSPTVGEMAGRLGIDEEEVVEGLEAAQAYQSASLDLPVTDEEFGPTLGDTLGREDEALENVEYHESLGPLLERLPERNRRILLLRFYGNQTQSQIAAQIGISQMHVSRLLSQTLARLRNELLCQD